MSKVAKPPQPGDRFGHWTVTGQVSWRQDKRQKRMMVPCVCDCGTERLVMLQSLRRRDRSAPSCGCWKAERARTIVAETRWAGSHGQAAGNGTALYHLWLGINRRCHNPDAENWKWYGGKGVQVWGAWRHDAGAFITWIEHNLGPRPAGLTPGGRPLYSLDRIDVTGNYEPGNLRWATWAEQARNRRRKEKS